MAEVLGVVGFLGQLFNGCITAYGIFTAAANLGHDSERLVCKIRIEEMRLRVWGREWGIAEGHLEAHLQDECNAGNNGMRLIAFQTLKLIHSTICDVSKLRDRYGLLEDAAEPAQGARKPSGKGTGTPAREDSFASSTSSSSSFASFTRVKTELNLRARWAIVDKDKFANLLQDLRDFNDGLEKIFPPQRQETMRRAWTHELLQTAQQDLAQLKLLETASMGTYTQLNVSANLKQLRINLDAQPQASFRPTFALKIKHELLAVSHGPERRGSASYKSPSHAEPLDVFVEWIDYDREDLDGRLNHIRRIDDLARMIHSASHRHPDLHTVDCIGYTDDAASNRYGLVYQAPASTFSSLYALLTSRDFRSPDLDDRFRLAHTLAVALWSLHSLDWLHKSVTSSNILFFPSAASQAATRASSVAATVPQIDKPYLVGFDASRPDAFIEMSVAPKSTTIDLYRHPSATPGLSKKPYCKSFDIYSLGLILLEIGMWKTLQSFHQHKPGYTAEKFRDKVILTVLLPTLGSKTGRQYKNLVERCLRVKEDLSSREAGNLMGDIVGTLASLNV